MRILLYENPADHNNTEFDYLFERLSKKGIDSDLVKTIQEAELKLEQFQYDQVIIHHYDYDEVDTLRGKHHKPQYGCYSKLLDDEDFIMSAAKHYDFLVPRIHGFIAKVSKQI